MAAGPAQIITALNHPIRRRILRIMEGEEMASASELAALMDRPLSRVAYHVNVLARIEVLVLVKSRKVRGATENFYRCAFSRQPGWAHAALAATREEDEARPGDR